MYSDTGFVCVYCMCVCVCGEECGGLSLGVSQSSASSLTGFHGNRNIEWRHVALCNATITIPLLSVPSPHISTSPSHTSIIFCHLFPLTLFPKEENKNLIKLIEYLKKTGNRSVKTFMKLRSYLFILVTLYNKAVFVTINLGIS